MVRGIVIVDNRGYRSIAVFLFLTLLLALPAGIRLWSASRCVNGDTLQIEQITRTQQTENERRISEIAGIRKQNLMVVQKSLSPFGG
jgi:hypothetical protein